MFVDVWFYNCRLDHRQNWLNRLVTAVDPPFCHCEIQIPSGEAFSVYSGSKVVSRDRTFDDQYYTCVRVPCSPAQLASVTDYCNTLVNTGVTFHPLCLLATVTGGAASYLINTKMHTCCSRMITEALANAEIINSRVDISPSALHRLVHPLSVPSNSTSYALDFC